MRTVTDQPTDSTSFVLTLRGVEKELFDQYMYTHIVNTGEIKITPATLARRLIIEHISNNREKLITPPPVVKHNC